MLAIIGIELPEGSPPAGYNWQLLGCMDFIAVTAKSHPLAKIRHITPDDLSHHRQLVAISRGGQLESESTLFGDRCWMCESSRVVRNLIIQGQGWGIVAHHHVKRDLASGRIIRLSMPFKKKLISSDICLVWKKGSPLSRPSEWLGNALKKALAD